MIKLTLSILFASTLISNFTFADDETRNHSLKSMEGVSIDASYLPVSEVSNSNKPQRTTFAKDLSLKASGISSERSDVEAVIILKSETIGSCGFPNQSSEKVFTLTLAYNPSTKTFEGSFPKFALFVSGGGAKIPVFRAGLDRLPIHVEGFCFRTKTQFEIALSVNGVWQTDPINRTHNFVISN